MDYAPPGGETWPKVKDRVVEYLNQIEHGDHLIFTHGGAITTLLVDHGV